MRIVGYQNKGNVIRFYLGSGDLTPKYRRDHGSDGVYPYSDFVVGYKDFVVGFDKTIFTEDFPDMSDLREGIAPLVVIATSTESDTNDGFYRYKGARNAYRYYLYDEMEPDEIGLPDNYPEKSLAD